MDAFREQMQGQVWNDRDAESLLDEAPDAYKDIAVVMSDSESLVRPLFELRSFINFKGVDRKRGRRAN